MIQKHFEEKFINIWIDNHPGKSKKQKIESKIKER